MLRRVVFLDSRRTGRAGFGSAGGCSNAVVKEVFKEARGPVSGVSGFNETSEEAKEGGEVERRHDAGHGDHGTDGGDGEFKEDLEEPFVEFRAGEELSVF